MKAEIVASPSGSSLKSDDVIYRTHPSGDAEFGVPYDKLDKDGDYEIKIYLINGSSISYKFNIRDLGDVKALRLDYVSTSIAAGSVLPEPGVFLVDTDDYELRKNYSDWLTDGNDFNLSISDASFMDGKMLADGSFKLKDDKSGTITMTVVDSDRNLVGTQLINVEKPASLLKLTPPTVTPVGQEAIVNIELVDIDGKLAATGIGAVIGGYSGAIISKPDGAIASVNSMDVTDFNKGKAVVRVTSNMDGDVIVQVIIKEDTKDIPGTGILNPGFDQAKADAYQASYDAWVAGGKVGAAPVRPSDAVEMLVPDTVYGGRTYTGAIPVSFGTAPGGGGQLIFFIGAPSYVAGNTPFAAQSPAFIENSRTFLGVRDIGNAIGGAIDWDEETQTATVSKDNTVVKITVGADVLLVTKAGATSEVPLDAAAQIRNDRVYLPFRALLQAFGYTVEWDEATQSIICTI